MMEYMGKTRNAYNIFIGNPQRMNQVGDLGIGRRILRWIIVSRGWMAGV
jgi:hypothetical protein